MRSPASHPSLLSLPNPCSRGQDRTGQDGPRQGLSCPNWPQPGFTPRALDPRITSETPSPELPSTQSPAQILGASWSGPWAPCYPPPEACTPCLPPATPVSEPGSGGPAPSVLTKHSAPDQPLAPYAWPGLIRDGFGQHYWGVSVWDGITRETCCGDIIRGPFLDITGEPHFRGH